MTDKTSPLQAVPLQAVKQSRGATRWDQPRIYVELDSKCNALCVFCPYPLLKDAGKKMQKMPPETFTHAVANIVAEGLKIVSFTPTTGEVLLHDEWAERMADVIALPSVETVYFYSNGILLHERNRARLLELCRSPKLELFVSLGGPDRQDYKDLYVVDQFDKIVANLRALMVSLDEGKHTTKLNIEVRIKSMGIFKAIGSFFKFKKHLKGLKYSNYAISVLDTFDPVGGSIPRSDLLQIRKPLPPKPIACQGLRNKRYAANGSVWVCGCVTSEFPGDESLRIGTIEDDLAELTARQTALFDGWQRDGKVPTACGGCTFYSKGKV